MVLAQAVRTREAQRCLPRLPLHSSLAASAVTDDRPAAEAASERIGARIGCPSARIALIQPRIASMPLVIASSIVAPSDMQPGRSGNSIR
jgi:hypothetical protein